MSEQQSQEGTDGQKTIVTAGSGRRSVKVSEGVGMVIGQSQTALNSQNDDELMTDIFNRQFSGEDNNSNQEEENMNNNNNNSNNNNNNHNNPPKVSVTHTTSSIELPSFLDDDDEIMNYNIDNDNSTMFSQSPIIRTKVSTSTGEANTMPHRLFVDKAVAVSIGNLPIVDELDTVMEEEEEEDDQEEEGEQVFFAVETPPPKMSVTNEYSLDMIDEKEQGMVKNKVSEGLIQGEFDDENQPLPLISIDLNASDLYPPKFDTSTSLLLSPGANSGRRGSSRSQRSSSITDLYGGLKLKINPIAPVLSDTNNNRNVKQSSGDMMMTESSMVAGHKRSLSAFTRARSNDSMADVSPLVMRLDDGSEYDPFQSQLSTAVSSTSMISIPAMEHDELRIPESMLARDMIWPPSVMDTQRQSTPPRVREYLARRSLITKPALLRYDARRCGMSEQSLQRTCARNQVIRNGSKSALRWKKSKHFRFLGSKYRLKQPYMSLKTVNRKIRIARDKIKQGLVD